MVKKLIRNLKLIRIALKLILLTWLLSLSTKVKCKLKVRRMTKMQKKKEEVLVEEPQVQETIPPYRGAKEENGVPFTEKHDVTPAEEKLNIDTKELAKDLVGASFEIAHLINKKIRVATEEEKVNIGEPFAKIIDKYDLTKYAKYFAYTDEIRLFYALSKAVSTRIKEVKETPITPNAPPMDES